MSNINTTDKNLQSSAIELAKAIKFLKTKCHHLTADEFSSIVEMTCVPTDSQLHAIREIFDREDSYYSPDFPHKKEIFDGQFDPREKHYNTDFLNKIIRSYARADLDKLENVFSERELRDFYKLMVAIEFISGHGISVNQAKSFVLLNKLYKDISENDLEIGSFDISKQQAFLIGLYSLSVRPDVILKLITLKGITELDIKNILENKITETSFTDEQKEAIKEATRKYISNRFPLEPKDILEISTWDEHKVDFHVIQTLSSIINKVFPESQDFLPCLQADTTIDLSKDFEVLGTIKMIVGDDSPFGKLEPKKLGALILAARHINPDFKAWESKDTEKLGAFIKSKLTAEQMAVFHKLIENDKIPLEDMQAIGDFTKSNPSITLKEIIESIAKSSPKQDIRLSDGSIMQGVSEATIEAAKDPESSLSSEPEAGAAMGNCFGIINVMCSAKPEESQVTAEITNSQVKVDPMQFERLLKSEFFAMKPDFKSVVGAAESVRKAFNPDLPNAKSLFIKIIENKVFDIGNKCIVFDALTNLIGLAESDDDAIPPVLIQGLGLFKDINPITPILDLSDKCKVEVGFMHALVITSGNGYNTCEADNRDFKHLIKAAIEIKKYINSEDSDNEKVIMDNAIRAAVNEEGAQGVINAIVCTDKDKDGFFSKLLNAVDEVVCTVDQKVAMAKTPICNEFEIMKHQKVSDVLIIAGLCKVISDEFPWISKACAVIKATVTKNDSPQVINNVARAIFEKVCDVNHEMVPPVICNRVEALITPNNQLPLQPNCDMDYQEDRPLKDVIKAAFELFVRKRVFDQDTKIITSSDKADGRMTINKSVISTLIPEDTLLINAQGIVANDKCVMINKVFTLNDTSNLKKLDVKVTYDDHAKVIIKCNDQTADFTSPNYPMTFDKSISCDTSKISSMDGTMDILNPCSSISIDYTLLVSGLGSLEIELGAN